MANYANLKSDIAGVIRTNTNEEITGDILQEQLLGMVDSLGAGFQYKGVATPTTAPGTPDENVFYIASTAGTYTNFGSLVVAEGEVAILKYNGSWAKEVMGAATAAQVTQLGQNVGYLTCGTAAATSAKTVSRSGFVLSKNCIFVLKFTNANTANDVTLNINNTGAIPFYYNGARASASNAFSADNLLVWYDGTNFRSITIPDFTQQPFGSAKRTIVSQDALRSLWANTAFVTCGTAGDTAAKEITLYNYALRAYTNIIVKFTYANTADAVTLNINGTGAKAFQIRDARCSSSNTFPAGAVFRVYFDGTYFRGVQLLHATDSIGDSDLFTMTQKGVKNALEPINGYLDLLKQQVGYPGGLLEQGGIDSGTGAETSSTKRVRTKGKISYPTHIVTNDGYRIMAVSKFYKNGSFAGEDYYGFADTFTRDLYITRDYAEQYDVRIIFGKDDRDQELSPSDDIISTFPTPTQEYMNVSAQPIVLPKLDNAKNKTLGVIQRKDAYNRRTGLVWSDDYCWRWANDNTLVTNCKSYKCIRLSDGTEVSGNDTEHVYPIASMTKLLAAVVICRYVTDWDETITVANANESNESFVQNGDVVTYANILASMMVASDNNAANAVMRPIGRKIDPSVATDDAAKQAFCDAMAQAASDIGMANTSNFISAVAYVNSTTTDLCKLLKYVNDTAQCAKIKDYWGQLTYTMSVVRNGSTVTYTITSTTPSTARDLIPEYVGGKTGSMSEPYVFLTWGFVWQSVQDNNYYAIALLDASFQSGRIYDARHIIDEAYGLGV